MTGSDRSPNLESACLFFNESIVSSHPIGQQEEATVVFWTVTASEAQRLFGLDG